MNKILLLLALLGDVTFPHKDTPDPAPPQVVDEVRADEWYVVTSDNPQIVVHLPEGVIDVEESEGPIKVRGKFSDGAGKVEVRTYKQPYVYFITAQSLGRVDLRFIPLGRPNIDIAREKLNKLADALPDDAPDQIRLIAAELVSVQPQPTDVVKQALVVVGLNPRPGPEPKPEPKPSGNVIVEIIEDTMNRSLPTSTVMSALAGWSEFINAGNSWIQYDVTTPEESGVAAMKEAGTTPLPVVIVRDKATRKALIIKTMPETFDEFKKLVSP